MPAAGAHPHEVIQLTHKLLVGHGIEVGLPVILVELLDLKLATEGLKTNMFDFVAAKLEERDARHFKAGATRFVVEPNLKEGKGGLRDLHTLFWIAKYRASAEPNQSAQIIDETAPRKSKDSWGVLDRILTDRERQIFMRAFDFLWKVRILIHVTAGRGEERLSFDLQPEIARRFSRNRPI